MERLTKKRLAQVKKWVEAYAGWQESGLGQRDYCEQAGLKYTQFKDGIKSARQAGAIEQSRRKSAEIARFSEEQAGFARVKIVESSQLEAPKAPAYCEIRFNGQGGIRIESVESFRDFMELIGYGSRR